MDVTKTPHSEKHRKNHQGGHNIYVLNRINCKMVTLTLHLWNKGEWEGTKIILTEFIKEINQIINVVHRNTKKRSW